MDRSDCVIIFKNTSNDDTFCASCSIERKRRLGNEDIHGNCPCHEVLGYGFSCANNLRYNNEMYTIIATRDNCINYKEDQCKECVIAKRYYLKRQQ